MVNYLEILSTRIVVAILELIRVPMPNFVDRFFLLVAESIQALPGLLVVRNKWVIAWLRLVMTHSSL